MYHIITSHLFDSAEDGRKEQSLDCLTDKMNASADKLLSATTWRFGQHPEGFWPKTNPLRRLSCEGRMGTGQQKAEPLLESRRKRQERTLDDGEGSCEGLREGVVWWV